MSFILFNLIISRTFLFNGELLRRIESIHLGLLEFLFCCVPKCSHLMLVGQAGPAPRNKLNNQSVEWNNVSHSDLLSIKEIENLTFVSQMNLVCLFHQPRMDQYFNQMEKIVKERKTSSRIRFMLQDVIDLRLVSVCISDNCFQWRTQPMFRWTNNAFPPTEVYFIDFSCMFQCFDLVLLKWYLLHHWIFTPSGKIHSKQ